MIWPWIHSIPCSQQILLYYLFLMSRPLLLRILKLAGHAAGRTVTCPKFLLSTILTQLLIRHIHLDKRNLLFLNPSLPPPDPPLRSSSVAPTEFYSDIAKAHGRVHAQLGDDQDFMFWKNMGKHNLVLWLDYTEEATTYHTLRYRRTFSYDDSNMWCRPLPLITSIPHRHTEQRCRFIRVKDSSQSSGMTHKLWIPHIGCVIPLLTSLLRSALCSCSYMDEMALNATRKNRARKEATHKELKVYARLFTEAKSAEIKSRFDNDVFDLVDVRKLKPKSFVTGQMGAHC